MTFPSRSPAPLRSTLAAVHVVLAFAAFGCGPDGADEDAGRSDAGGADGGSGDRDGGAVSDGGADSDACPVVHRETDAAGRDITVCDEAYGSAPFVRLPADSASEVYGGIVRRLDAGLELVFMTRDTSNPIASPPPAWVGQEALPGDIRYGYYLYRARVDGGAVQELTPVVRVDDRVLGSVLAAVVLGGRAIEGLASARTVDASSGEVRFAYDDHTVPMRIRFDAAPDEASFDDATGYPRHALYGTIENAHTAVTGSDGACLPALDTLAEANPFSSATGDGDRVMLLRHPDMHGAFDDVFTIDWPEGTVPGGNNMGAGLFLSTAELLLAAPPTRDDASSFPHGVPWAGPSATLSVVDGGGDPCAP
ncbi:MAG: hypothetical protein AB7S26_09770 [Sandaracinaceae bacterium]